MTRRGPSRTWQHASIEAARTARRLPPVRVQGYFNCWPAIVRMQWELSRPTSRSTAPSLQAPRRSSGCWRRCGGCSGWRSNSGTSIWMRAKRYPLEGHLRPLCLRSDDCLAAVAAGTCRSWPSSCNGGQSSASELPLTLLKLRTGARSDGIRGMSEFQSLRATTSRGLFVVLRLILRAVREGLGAICGLRRSGRDGHDCNGSFLARKAMRGARARRFF